MSQNRRIVLWRHGRTEWNASRRFQGQTDIPLDDIGIAQAHNAAEQLATLNPSRIISLICNEHLSRPKHSGTCAISR
jgi:probable phosphoglycerate mutase